MDEKGLNIRIQQEKGDQNDEVSILGYEKVKKMQGSVIEDFFLILCKWKLLNVEISLFLENFVHYQFRFYLRETIQVESIVKCSTLEH